MKKKSQTKQFSSLRFYSLILLLTLATGVLITRILFLQIFHDDFLRAQGNNRAVRTINTHAYRGTITDRNGEPLAVTTFVDSIWLNPKKFVFSADNINQISKLSGISTNRIKSLYQQNKNKSFIYLKRQINPSIGKAFKSANIPGVYISREYRRYYPTGEVSAHLVGFTNIDDKGQEGIELLYDDWLKGKTGKKKLIRDRLGHAIDNEEIFVQAEPGQPLSLTIEKKLQYLTYRELKRVVAQEKAIAGSAVILDVKTGEVLAMANQPAYNPNNRSNIKLGHVRNRAVTDTYEPGSVIKAFSIAAALESGQYTSRSVIDTSPGFYKVDGHLIRDIRNYGVLDLSGIISKSSNVGISKVIETLEPGSYPKLLEQFGFGENTGSHFPGERQGTVVKSDANDKFTPATQTYGYALSVTTLQLARAFAALANEGVLLPVKLIKTQEPQEAMGRQVVSKATAKQVLNMLETVIKTGGSGTRAQVTGFHVTGKTGTTRKLTKAGYTENKHRALFAGIIPATNPRLVMVVMVDEPSRGNYYGGLIAAPVFAKVMQGATRLLNIPPDDLASLTIIDSAKIS